jgi:hypothetical protein
MTASNTDTNWTIESFDVPPEEGKARFHDLTPKPQR